MTVVTGTPSSRAMVVRSKCRHATGRIGRWIVVVLLTSVTIQYPQAHVKGFLTLDRKILSDYDEGMSRKHYVEIARSISTQVATSRENGLYSVEQALRLVVHDLCDMFKRDNAAFDRSRFLTACGF